MKGVTCEGKVPRSEALAGYSVTGRLIEVLLLLPSSCNVTLLAELH